MGGIGAWVTYVALKEPLFEPPLLIADAVVQLVIYIAPQWTSSTQAVAAGALLFSKLLEMN
jgi:hypothetical protein